MAVERRNILRQKQKKSGEKADKIEHFNVDPRICPSQNPKHAEIWLMPASQCCLWVWRKGPSVLMGA
jgi:hypothetical protein